MTEVHRILGLKQSDWIKKYIDFNTDKWKNKLMNNSVFGDTMKNLRKRISVKLANNAKDYVRSKSKPSFVLQKIFSKNFVAIHEIKPVLTLINQSM